MALLFLLAEALAEPLSGGAGWAGVGLLGGVLSWLLFIHLPSKDKQLKEFIEAKDTQINKLATDFGRLLTENQNHCKEEILLGRQEHKEQMAMLLDRLGHPTRKGGS